VWRTGKRHWETEFPGKNQRTGGKRTKEALGGFGKKTKSFCGDEKGPEQVQTDWDSFPCFRLQRRKEGKVDVKDRGPASKQRKAGARGGGLVGRGSGTQGETERSNWEI